MIVYLFLANFPKGHCKENLSHINQAMGVILTNLLSKMDKTQMPTLTDYSDAHVIDIQVRVNSIYDVSELDSSFKVNFLLQLHWQDLRFQFEPPKDSNDLYFYAPINRLKDSGMTSIASSSYAEHCSSCFCLLSIISLSAFFWDIILTNEKDTNSFLLWELSSMNSAVFLAPHGSFFFSRKVVSKVRCLMNPRKYLHDTQVCELIFQSNAFESKILKFGKHTMRMHPQALESSALVII